MPTFWTTCKLGVNVQATFDRVMLLFEAALVGVFVLPEKVGAMQRLREIFQAELENAAKFAVSVDAERRPHYRLAARQPAAPVPRVGRFCGTPAERRS